MPLPYASHYLYHTFLNILLFYIISDSTSSLYLHLYISMRKGWTCHTKPNITPMRLPALLFVIPHHMMTCQLFIMSTTLYLCFSIINSFVPSSTSLQLSSHNLFQFSILQTHHTSTVFCRNRKFFESTRHNRFLWSADAFGFHGDWSAQMKNSEVSNNQ